MVRAVGAEAVVHTQALSDVDRCEQAPEEAMRHNVQATAHLCEALKGSGALLIGLSTDYVFDGATSSPYDEEDTPGPLSVYGRSKLAGEQLMLKYPRGMIVRPSTLFGPDRMNFCNAIVQRLREGLPVQAFLDQTTSPTYTADLAEGLEAFMKALQGQDLAQMPRVYHLANAGGCTRVEFAMTVAALLQADRSLIEAIPMAQQHRPAPRPCYSALVSRHLPQMMGRTLRPWQDALRAYLNDQGWLN